MMIDFHNNEIVSFLQGLSILIIDIFCKWFLYTSELIYNTYNIFYIMLSLCLFIIKDIVYIAILFINYEENQLSLFCNIN